MDYNINFPHLGIFLDHVGKNISIGNFTIAYYGIVIAIGMLIGLRVAMWRAKETGQKPADRSSGRDVARKGDRPEAG